MPGRRILFVYADPAGFSGQRNAAKIVWEGLGRRGWTCRLFPLPTANRTTSSTSALARWAWNVAGLFRAWWNALKCRFRDPSDVTFLACSQTIGGLVRDGMAFMLLTFGSSKTVKVISLNGNLFATWARADLRATLLRFLARHSSCVTVVGDQQRRHLIRLGLPAAKVCVVTNTADAPILPLDLVLEKHRATSQPVQILYLSSLITSKGYPLLLEALAWMGNRPGPRLEALLCGTIVASPHDTFGAEPAAKAWINGMIAAINESSRVRIRWLHGVIGAEKHAVLLNCHIFVLPTQYPVEAQPLALLEAMASGCAIITTGIAEIPAILPPKTGVATILDQPSPQTLAAEIDRLAVDVDLRIAMGMSAHARYAALFSPERHLDDWESLLVGPGDSQ